MSERKTASHFSWNCSNLPNLLFVIAVFVFHEPINPVKLAAFVLIWLALLIYTADGLWPKRPALRA